MKKLVLVAALTALSASVFAASPNPASATATWKASALKKAESSFSVTAMNDINFTYGESSKSFSTHDGIFEIALEGQNGATDFKLTSEVQSNELTRTDDSSVLTVGVSYNGQTVDKATPFNLMDTAANINGGLNNILNGYADATARSTETGRFDFKIASAADGASQVAFDQLKDGSWNGTVAVRFVATWITATP